MSVDVRACVAQATLLGSQQPVSFHEYDVVTTARLPCQRSLWPGWTIDTRALASEFGRDCVKTRLVERLARVWQCRLPASHGLSPLHPGGTDAGRPTLALSVAKPEEQSSRERARIRSLFLLKAPRILNSNREFKLPVAVPSAAIADRTKARRHLASKGPASPTYELKPTDFAVNFADSRGMAKRLVRSGLHPPPNSHNCLRRHDPREFLRVVSASLQAHACDRRRVRRGWRLAVQ